MTDAPDPVPVSIVTPNPIPVTLDRMLTTSAEQDRNSAGHRNENSLRTAGQRHINVMWERTQQFIAVMVTVVVLAVSSYLAVLGSTDLRIAAVSLLSGAFSLIVGTYFQRTNHVKVGGVGGGRDEDTR